MTPRRPSPPPSPVADGRGARKLGYLGDSGVPIWGVPRLCERERALVDAIRRYRETHAYGPTVRELRAMLGWSSTSVVSYWVDSLVWRGILLRDGHAMARTLRVA